MEVVYWIAGGCLALAALLTLVRIWQGPGALDRVVATDVLLAIVVGSIAIEEAMNRHSFGLPIMLVVSLIAFIGTVSVARFVATKRMMSSAQARPEAVLPDDGAARPDTPNSGESR